MLFGNIITPILTGVKPKLDAAAPVGKTKKMPPGKGEFVSCYHLQLFTKY